MLAGVLSDIIAVKGIVTVTLKGAGKQGYNGEIQTQNLQRDR